MPAKKFYVRYLEGREKLLISSSAVMVYTKSFSKGCTISRSAGYATKKSCLSAIAEVNAAAGKEIAVYAGSFVPPAGWESYQLPEAA